MKGRPINTLEVCRICESPLIILGQDLFDVRFGVEEYFSVGRCRRCGLEQLSPLPSQEELKDLYEKYYNFSGSKSARYEKVRAFFLSSWCSKVWAAIDGDINFNSRAGTGRLIDIGCNEGRNLDAFKRAGFHVTGIEINEIAAGLARERGHEVHNCLLDDFQPDALYDIAVLSNVLEHDLNPLNLLKNVSRILKKGGEVWISCPNAKSWQRSLFKDMWINWHVPFHVVHFSRDSLSRVLETAGFKVGKVEQESPALWLAYSIISKQLARPGQPTKQFRNPILVATLMMLIRGLLFPLLWLGNMSGRGDCLVVVAKKE